MSTVMEMENRPEIDVESNGSSGIIDAIDDYYRGLNNSKEFMSRHFESQKKWKNFLPQFEQNFKRKNSLLIQKFHGRNKYG